ncbi:ADP-ribosylglycohydrolase [sediment metagenome]|uniref:ADP-ribosylglycohydrolase n=1 Tax=sediment metagenome TaxID=749907 RepID=D9PIH2_9ZZZZ
MIGAIAGDIIGSVYEYVEWKAKDFPLLGERCVFTDDTVLTVAVAKAILENQPYRDAIRELGSRYPFARYGRRFSDWLFFSEGLPYNSWGSGSAMRVSPVGFAHDTEEKVLEEAKKTAEFTHNDPEGIKGAQATALAILRARSGASKEDIRCEVTERFSYDLSRTVDDIRPNYRFNGSCEGSVPQAVVAFLDSESYEDAVRNAVSLGGDADTLACIAGGIAQAYYGGVPVEIVQWAKKKLTPELLEITEAFCERFGIA